MGGKKSRESQIRASVKYNKAHDYFGIRPDKETGAAIWQAAAAAGQSVQRYILDAVQSRMEKCPRLSGFIKVGRIGGHGAPSPILAAPARRSLSHACN